MEHKLLDKKLMKQEGGIQEQGKQDRTGPE